MFEKIKQLKDLRDQAKTLQNMLGQETIHHDTKGGKLAIVLDGNLKVLSITVDPSYLQPDKKAELEAGLKELTSEAIEKAQRAMAMKVRSSGLQLPGLS